MKTINCMVVILAIATGFAADPAWPSDFNARMAARVAEATPVGIVATLAISSDPVVLFAGGIASSAMYGDESNPFDSWFRTYLSSGGIDFNSRKTRGVALSFR